MIIPVEIASYDNGSDNCSSVIITVAQNICYGFWITKKVVIALLVTSE